MVVGIEGFVMGRIINRFLLLERISLGHGDGEVLDFEPELVLSMIAKPLFYV